MDVTGLRGRDYLLALLLFVLSAAALGWAQRDLGIMRDEATYFEAAERYWGWFDRLGESGGGKALTRQAITRHWQYNNEHPVLLKTLFAVSWRVFRKTGPHAAHGGIRTRTGPALGWLSETSAFRLPAWLLTGLAVALLYLFGVRIESRIAGLTAALLYITMPRVFFHGQLACFDSGITTLWLLTVYAYYRALERARWSLWLGVFFGLALAAKHNAWFLPPLLLGHYLFVVWPDLSLRPFRPPRIPLLFIAMALVGPLVFFAHWPWLWFDTYHHLKAYFAFHLHHAFYNMEYLGVNWGQPPLPISYPFGMTLFTVPTVTLLLGLFGFALFLRPPLLTTLARWIGVRPPALDTRFRFPARRSWLRPGLGLDPRVGTLLGVNALFPLVLIALPQTPIFGGTKHWLPAYPFLALLAGITLSRLFAQLFARSRLSPVLAFALPLALALPGAANIYGTQPYGLSQYNALAGGPAGGADLGLNRQFWGYAVRGLLPWLNENLRENTRVYFHDTNWGSYRAYIREGLLRPDIRYAGMELPAIRASDVAIVIHELHFNKYEYWIWQAYQTATPVKVLALDGVPLVTVYARPSAIKGRSP